MRDLWEIAAPPGGWGSPWPQCVELARHLSADQWTLVGGLMVQLHSAAAALAVTRPTADVDIVLHIETGAATAGGVQQVLGDLRYTLHASIDSGAPAHRFVRGDEQIDVMIADHAAPNIIPRIGGRRPFLLPAGTQALQRAVNCRITLPDEEPVLVSIPNALGALVLKGAAYQEDSRDKSRHLDDAAVLLATVKDPLGTTKQMKGSDRSRIRALKKPLSDPGHTSWLLLEAAERQPAHDALRILAADPPSPQPLNRLKRVIGITPTGAEHVTALDHDG